MGKTYERRVQDNDDVRRLYEDVLNMPDVELYRGYAGTEPGQGVLVDFEVDKGWYRRLEPGEWGVNPSYIPEITIPFDEMFEGVAKDGKV